ncbi:uncharacterized protein PHALS_06226 [Plasmopara halstedii]|uniref:Uncharacterized protein n=1 Tax=Plasmopara halstedii TaxID=4781 RepID=A0A0P1B143_PLAHL|nr:uncharacterized protein PHALS_06226 [Plasmopara halstedii]CEG48401.1 hypothetical protein PHALS_06226 [Plasmopara halstedii]|eukprot:XP_024584770.1 hypothetical protein PHALS_06226 [Plasmopara halstedii]
MVAYADALVLVCDFAIFVIDSMEALPASRAKKVVNMGSSSSLPSALTHFLIKIFTEVLSEPLRQYAQRLQRADWGTS